MNRELCESAKRGKVCPDDLCHGGDVTLCGFDKEAYEEMLEDDRELDEGDFLPYDEWEKQS